MSVVVDGPSSVRLRYQAASARPGEQAPFTVVDFLSVLEYRWIAFDQTHFLSDRDDYAFNLIEILNSEQIAAQLDNQMLRNAPVGERLGGHLCESALHHYRIGFDDYGTFESFVWAHR